MFNWKSSWIFLPVSATEPIHVKFKFYSKDHHQVRGYHVYIHGNSVMLSSIQSGFHVWLCDFQRILGRLTGKWNHHSMLAYSSIVLIFWNFVWSSDLAQEVEVFKTIYPFRLLCAVSKWVSTKLTIYYHHHNHLNTHRKKEHLHFV